MKTTLALLAFGVFTASANDALDELQAFADRLNLDFSSAPTDGCDPITCEACVVAQLVNPAVDQAAIPANSRLRRCIDTLRQGISQQRRSLLRKGQTTTNAEVDSKTQSILSTPITDRASGIDDLPALNALGKALDRALDARRLVTPAPVTTGSLCGDILAENRSRNGNQCSNLRDRRECDCDRRCVFSGRVGCDRRVFPHTSNGRLVSALESIENTVGASGLVIIPAGIGAVALALAARHLLSKKDAYVAVPAEELVV